MVFRCLCAKSHFHRINMTNANHSILWRRLDHAGHESALIFSDNDSWLLTGTAVFLYDGLPCRLDYRIVCDSQWHSRSAYVAGWVGNDLIERKLVITPDQRWLMNDKNSPQ